MSNSSRQARIDYDAITNYSTVSVAYNNTHLLPSHIGCHGQAIALLRVFTVGSWHTKLALSGLLLISWRGEKKEMMNDKLALKVSTHITLTKTGHMAFPDFNGTRMCNSPTRRDNDYFEP